jgi:hypothetical protein
MILRGLEIVSRFATADQKGDTCMSKSTFTRRDAALVAVAGLVGAAAVGTPSKAEYQPAMQAALDALYAARGWLVAATGDKGGHRLAAIARVDQAINQVKLGIEYDNTH